MLAYYPHHGFLWKVLHNSLKEEDPATKETDRIAKEMGFYNQEFLDAYLKSHPSLKGDDYFTLAEIYIELEDYEKAKDALSHVSPSSMFDDINQGQFEHLWITILLFTNRWDEAIERFNKSRSFLDVFMSSPVRASIAGDYNENAAIISAISENEKDANSYLSRLREWCDLFPKNRLLVEITETEILLVTNKRAEDALLNCEQSILHYSKFKHGWERENLLKKLNHARRLKHEEPPHIFH